MSPISAARLLEACGTIPEIAGSTMEFMSGGRYAAGCKKHSAFNDTNSVAKPKKRPTLGKKESSKPAADSSVAASQAQASSELESDEASKPLAPLVRRPLLFKLAFVAFVGWLVYLAYVAYVVLGR